MTIKLIFEPGKEVGWEEFRTSYPAMSVALDGYCVGGPGFDEERLILNIDHHVRVDRIATRSSCLQAMIHVKMGIFDGFCDEAGRPCMTVYCNGCDQDVALATYILLHPEHIDRPKLRELVRAEDLMDMSGGLYPSKQRLHLMKELNWIMRPYTAARASGKLHELDGKGMEKLVREMHRRIKLSLFNGAKQVDVDTSFEVVAEHPGWTLVREIGEAARIGMAEKRIKAFVSIIGESNGRRHYAIGRLSPFIPFPVARLYEALNRAEGLGPEAKHRWGGSNTIGGSPRQVGSKLTPEQIEAIVCELLSKRRRRCSSAG